MDWILRAVHDPRFFPSILIVLDFAAASRWAFVDGEWRKAVYWAAAGVLTATVTW